MKLIETIESFSIPLELFAPIVSRKIEQYAELLDLMHEHNGWLPYPDFVLKYFESIGAENWADLYFRAGIKKAIEENKDPIIEALQSIAALSPTPAIAHELICESLISLDEAMKAEEADSDSEQESLAKIDVGKLTDEERKEHSEFWIVHHLSFFNDLSLATHCESIFSLVHKASELNDDDALAKAIQIDRSLLPYFQKRIFRQSMQGKSEFFDSLSYRLNNAPARGTNKHPLLWILFNNLHQIGCLRSSITSKQILDVYKKAIPEHPKYSIDDELTIQRQRRKFMEMYRQPK